MATLSDSAQRASFATLALQTLGACPRWDAALTARLRAEELQMAYAEYGPYGQAKNALDWARGEVESQLGESWKDNPDEKAKIDALAAECSRTESIWEDEYIAAQADAELTLLQTPAPTVAAAMYKSWLIDAEELHNSNRFPTNCMEILRNDFARLEGTEPNAFDPAAWLSRFEKIGGGYIHTPDDQVRLVRASAGFTDEELAKCRALQREISEEHLEQVYALIRSRCDTTHCAPATWAGKLAVYRVAKAQIDAWEKVGDTSKVGSPENIAHEDETARLSDFHKDAVDNLMLTPAPDVEALAIKLDIFAEERLSDGWDDSGRIANLMAEDAHRLIGTPCVAEAA